MSRHRFASHTPDEMRRLSNLGHLVEGSLTAAVGVLALLATLTAAEWPNSAYAGLMAGAGVLLLILLYPRHPVSDWGAIWRDPQQREHTIMATALVLAGVAELVAAGRPPLGFTWPAALVLIGLLFLTHAQHGSGEAMAQAVRRHRWIGASGIAAGVLRFLSVLRPAVVWDVLWAVAVLAVAAQLLLYREPEGAFEVADASHHGGH